MMRVSMPAGTAILVAVCGFAGAENGPRLTKRQQLRAFVQVEALKLLAPLEGQELYPTNASRAKAERKKAERDAVAAVAAQYGITQDEMRAIAQRGLRERWPRPEALTGAELPFLPKEDRAASIWRHVVEPNDCVTGKTRVVKDVFARGRRAAETLGDGWNFDTEPIKLPAAGTYRLRFYLRSVAIDTRTDEAPRVDLAATAHRGSRADFRTMATRKLDGAEIGGDYAPHELTVTFARPEGLRVVVATKHCTVRINCVTVELLPEQELPGRGDSRR